MSTNRSRRIDRDTAEQLLGGAVVGSSAGQAPVAGHSALAGLLAAAAAAPPTGDAELPGERQAMAAFREARRAPAHETRRRTMAGAAPTRAFSLKAVLAAFAITAIGGVAVAAVAAGTGALPVALGGSPAGDTTPTARQTPVTTSSPARVLPGRSGTGTAPGSDGPGSGRASDGPGATGTPKPSDESTDRSSADPDHPGTSAGPGQDSSGPDAPGRSSGPVREQTTAQLVRLCETLVDREAAGGKTRQLLAEPLLAPLLAVSGGLDHVDAYCKAVIARSGQGNGGQGNEPSAGPTAERPRSTPPGRTGTPDGALPALPGLVGGAALR
ncbi:hypothetical protein GCM10009760_20370 [Kitasatospora kazusensis]|uniref:Uncharacterized protein n=1 Tax=Kitasatospora kazusensis TaxID=407974 RepID=A0ABN2Z968_9ACTN